MRFPKIEIAAINTRMPIGLCLALLFYASTTPPLVAQTGLAETMAVDVALQNNVIIALRRALGARDQISVNRRGKFTDEVRPYTEIYRSLNNSNTLENIQNRYAAARADLIDSRLPEAIAELVIVIESLRDLSFN